MFTKMELLDKSSEIVASATFLWGVTREQLEGQLSLDAYREVSPHVEVATSGFDSSRSLVNEERVTVCRGSRTYFEDALDLWIAVVNQTDVDEYDVHNAKETLCEPVTGRELEKLFIEQNALLQKHFKSGRRGRFVAANRMYLKWNYSVVLSETTEEFIAYFWSLAT